MQRTNSIEESYFINKFAYLSQDIICLFKAINATIWCMLLPHLSEKPIIVKVYVQKN